MNKDIVPNLLDDMLKYFDKCIEKNSKIQKFYSDVDKEKANQTDVFDYSKEIGSVISDTILKYITEENLPDGVLYWNVAERTITPLYEKAHELINKYFIIINTYEDKKRGIGLKTIPSSFPKQRVRDVINKYVEVFNEVEEDER